MPIRPFSPPLCPTTTENSQWVISITLNSSLCSVPFPISPTSLRVSPTSPLERRLSCWQHPCRSPKLLNNSRMRWFRRKRKEELISTSTYPLLYPKCAWRQPRNLRCKYTKGEKLIQSRSTLHLTNVPRHSYIKSSFYHDQFLWINGSRKEEKNQIIIIQWVFYCLHCSFFHDI